MQIERVARADADHALSHGVERNGAGHDGEIGDGPGAERRATAADQFDNVAFRDSERRSVGRMQRTDAIPAVMAGGVERLRVVCDG